MTNIEEGVSVVVPVYRGSVTLPELTDRVDATLGPLTRYEIVLVDDGSDDDSWKAIEALSAEHPQVRGLRLSRNFGQHNALLAGIRSARFAATVTMDDDLQHPPEEIPKLLTALVGDTDVVYGTPIDAAHDRWRIAGSQITRLALRGPIGAQTARKVSAFRAFRTPVRHAFAGYDGPFVSIDVLLTWGTTHFEAVEVDHHPRKHGTSNYRLASLLGHAVDMMTGFSTLPLRIASLIGFTFATFGVGVLVYVVGRTWINGGSVPGFPFLASIIAVFSGAQLFALGIVGEYLARMHFRLMQKPAYVVGEATDDAADPPPGR